MSGVDFAGTVRQRADLAIEFPTPHQALDLMTAVAELLVARQAVARERVCGVGIGIPGPMSPAGDGEGYVVTPSAFPGWHDVPLASQLERRLRMPVLLENNVTAAAVGERWYGAGRHIDTFFYVFLGGGLVRTPADLDPLLAAGHPRLLAWMDTAAAHLTGLVLAVEYLIDPEAIVLGAGAAQTDQARTADRAERGAHVGGRVTRRVARRAIASAVLSLPGLAAGAQGTSSAASPRIRVNQVGFYPSGPKVAVVAADPSPATFAVLTADRGDTVFVGALSPAARWAPSQEVVRRADFGALTRPGRYVLAVPGVGRSDPFTVGPAVVREVARAALKAFYFQRASTSLPTWYAGPWARAAGHPDDVVLVHPSAASPGRPAGTRISAPRGWYDAGDYNKYVVNSGISTYTLLALAEQFPDYVAALDTRIPESGNALPDVLDEALWNLGWMRAMQDPADGGVYHKLTNAEFDKFVMPAAATAPRYVVQKSTAATLDFAAVAAHAALVVRRYPRALPGLADSLVREAVAAWGWARQHPDSTYDQGRLNARFTPHVNTGAYGDTSLADEFRWAAAELYLATRQDSFFVAAAPLATPAPGVPSWSSVGMLGLYSLLEHRGELPAGSDTAALVQRVVGPADALAARTRASAYGVPIGAAGDFVWGSNAVTANQGVLLLQAYRLTGASAFRDAAVAALDYLLGRNATGYSFVTGFGARPPRFPHHRPSAADTVAAPVPGFLVGGPNPGQQDGCPGYPSRVPALSYVDSTCAYAANEVAINWNAPLAYLTAAVDAAYSSAPREARPGRAVREQRDSR